MLYFTARHRMLDRVKNYAIFTAPAFRLQHIGATKRLAFHNIDLSTSKSGWGKEKGNGSEDALAKFTLTAVHIAYAQKFYIAT